MAIAVIQRAGESNEKTLNRHKRKSSAARRNQIVRAGLRFEKKPNKTKLKRAALIREKYRNKRAQRAFY